MRGAASMLALILATAPVSADTPMQMELTNAKTKEICAAAARRPLPPPESAGPAPAECDLVSLYDGIGGTPDYKRALACALHGKTSDTDSPFDSDAILSMLYANGSGVVRNDDLAVAYVCRARGAGAEIEGRIDHLLKRKAEGAAAKPFDFCDDITSGYMQGWCTARGERRRDVARAAKLKALTRSLGPAARAAYSRLEKAHETYVQAIRDNEVDTSGTARSMFLIAAESKEQDNLAAALAKVLPPARLPGNKAAYAKADARLNAVYKRLQATADGDLGTVTHAGIKTTERAWLAYRDAFLAFAAMAAPSASRDGVAALLTEQRTAKLGDLQGESQP